MDKLCTLTEHHCRNLLTGYGWPRDMEIAFRLSYSQGDGAAFYGHLTCEDLSRILEQQVSRGELRKAECRRLVRRIEASDTVLYLERNAFGHRYAHAGCIRYVWRDGDCAPDNDVAGEIESLIRSDVEALCRQMACDGYLLQEAMLPSSEPVVFQRNTANFVVRVEETEDVYCGDDDAEFRNELIALILDKGACYRPLAISVVSTTSGNTMGTAWAGDALRLPGQPVRAWFDRHWLTEATEEARQTINALTQAFSTFVKTH
ncbi:hypothetical protein ACI2I2_24265 [Scandinavium sp. NPDC088450]|uniref:hypothetical protein n=1 Tax=Scandinavium sp. NPDC088450 TaxID=3364514 RepID=UPI00384D7B04